MDAASSALMLWFGLTVFVPKAPTYEIGHFYTYDREHKQQALPLQKKVFISTRWNSESYIPKTNQSIAKLESPHIPGWIITTETNGLAIQLMDELAKAEVSYQPVVKWDGVDCLPTSSLIIQTKPFVTEKLLRQRLKDSAQVTVLDVKKGEGNQWMVEIGETIMPPNILVLANMIAEDTVWVDWAKVVFSPIFAPMSGVMSVTTPAVVNLGYHKELTVVITVYKPTVKIRKDLLPKLGENGFVPAPQKDDVWYDFGQTTVTEERTAEKYVIRMTTPFRYLNYGKIQIQPISIPFDDGKIQGTFWVSGIEYVTQSVIEDTGIADIQAMPEFPAALSLPEPKKFVRVVLPWQDIGLLGAGLGVGLFLLVCVVAGVKVANKSALGRAATNANRRLWEELRAAANMDDSNWRAVYVNTSEKLAKVLVAFYNIKVPVSSDNVAHPNLHNIMVELEKLYQPNAQPNVCLLVNSVNLFVEQDGKWMLEGNTPTSPLK